MGKERLMTALIIIEGVVIILLAVLVAGLLKSHAEILRQLNALGVGEDGSVTVGTPQTRPKTTGFEKAPASTLTGVDVSGSSLSVSLEHGRGNTLLAFLSSGCLSCETFWHEFNGDFDLPTPDTRTVIVTKGPNSESPAKIRELAPSRLPLLMSDDMWDTFRVPMTPYFLLVDGAGLVIGEGAASSWRHLLGLLRQSAADAANPIHLDTEGRRQFTDIQLRSAGVNPGDPSLYENPLEKQ
jgi:hypothetical protein